MTRFYHRILIIPPAPIVNEKYIVEKLDEVGRGGYRVVAAVTLGSGAIMYTLTKQSEAD